MATKNNALDILIEIAKDKKIPFYNLELITYMEFIQQ